MSDGYTVDAAQVRRHAENVEALRGRFEAVKTASAHIAQDDQAYGLLREWIPWAVTVSIGSTQTTATPLQCA